jgi:hypothetical protein
MGLIEGPYFQKKKEKKRKIMKIKNKTRERLAIINFRFVCLYEISLGFLWYIKVPVGHITFSLI